jgi:hypothetical protein
MVQVDIFWSYGIGAGLALAAHNQIVKTTKQSATAWEAATHSPFFVKMLLFVGLVFVPSGFWLLWQFPSWETMHAGDRDLPVWLVGLFSVTNVSQAVLGYLIAQECIRRHRVYAAWASFVAAYTGFFFILVHGWDGIGYKRFFSSDPSLVPNWTWAVAGDWFTSDVAFTLYGMGVILLPSLVGLTLSWLRGMPEGRHQSAATVTLGYLGSIFGVALGTAILCAVSLINLGPIFGFLASVAIVVLAFHPRFGVGPLFFRWMTGKEAQVPQNGSRRVSGIA